MTFFTGGGTSLANRLPLTVLQHGGDSVVKKVIQARQRFRTSNCKSIAIFRALQLGDVLCAVPAMRAIRQAAPAARIELISLPWARSFTERFAATLDGFIEFPGHPGLPERPLDDDLFSQFLRDVRSRKLDLVVQMHGSGGIVNKFCMQLGAKHVAGYWPSHEQPPEAGLFLPYPEQGHEADRHLALAEFLGAPAENRDLSFPLQPTDERDLETALAAREIVPGRYICLHPGARYLSRRWPAERYAAVGDRLVQAGFDVVLTGSAEEAPLTAAVADAMSRPCIDLAGRTTLGAAALLASRSALVITNDTGMSHIADAVDARSIVLVLGSDARRWAPRNRKRHRVLSHAVPCQPCEHRVCPIDFPCGSGLVVDEVVRAAFEMLDHAPSPIGGALSCQPGESLASLRL